MSKYLKLVPCEQYRMTEQEIMECKRMGVLFGSHSYNHSISYIGKIREEIAHEFPTISDDEIYVYEIHRVGKNCGGFVSDRFASHTMLFCSIPAEDYIRLKRNGEIKSL